VLKNGFVATRLPCQDLDRARRFYSEKLGLEPVDERPGGLLYPSKGARGERGGWFRDSEGNLLGVGEPVR
jgi:catechol 2,3-dioxygenase-like lactoylglutathione lyase family enzyme